MNVCLSIGMKEGVLPNTFCEHIDAEDNRKKVPLDKWEGMDGPMVGTLK